MSQLEEIRERLDLCDKKIVSVLEERMDIIKEIMVYKKENGLPILQPEQEKRQRKMLLTHVDENTYKDEILDIFTYIVENSRRIQAKTLFTHNILLIDIPSFFTISSSISTCGDARILLRYVETVLLPAPINPINKMLCVNNVFA